MLWKFLLQKQIKMPVRHDAQANLMIDKLKEQMDSIKAENAQLRAQNADLIECKMDLYLQDRRSKLSKLNVEDYQKLIFG